MSTGHQPFEPEGVYVQDWAEGLDSGQPESVCDVEELGVQKNQLTLGEGGRSRSMC